MLITRLLNNSLRKGVRKCSTNTTNEASGTFGTPNAKTTVSVPIWGLVGLGTAAAGFFGNKLHSDIQDVRNELRANRQEFREDMRDLRNKVDEGFREIFERLPPRPQPK